MSASTYPAGWGWHPEARVGGVTAADLPDLPLLRLIKCRRRRNDAILQAIDSVHGLRDVITAKDVASKYDIPNPAAWDLLHRRRKPCAT